MLREQTVNIIRDFCQFIGADNCSQWHIGVTAQTEHSLFKGLNMVLDSRWYIHRRADSAVEARTIAKAFWNIECQKSPLDEDSGGESAVYVFAHRMPPVLTGIIIDSQARSHYSPAEVSS